MIQMHAGPSGNQDHIQHVDQNGISAQREGVISQNTPEVSSSLIEKHQTPPVFSIQSLMNQTDPNETPKQRVNILSRVKQQSSKPPFNPFFVPIRDSHIPPLPQKFPTQLFQNIPLSSINTTSTFPIHIANPPMNSVINYRQYPSIIPRQVHSQPNTPLHSFKLNENHSNPLIKCVCGSSEVDGKIIQCSKCKSFLHAICINIARETKNYICPLCANINLRCSCEKNSNFSEPIIQCVRCNNYVHRSCEEISMGLVPKGFVCKKCGGSTLHLPKVQFSPGEIESPPIAISCDRSAIINQLPDGLFKSMVIEDLDKDSLMFSATIERYFDTFGAYLFERPHEFWKVFATTLSTILCCDKLDIILAIDKLSFKLLYNQNAPPAPLSSTFSFNHSDSISNFLSTTPIPFVNEKDVAKDYSAMVVNEDGVKASRNIDDLSILCLIPGFLMHMDEVNADSGIPRTYVTVTDTSLVIDTTGTSFQPIALNVKRSFQFNLVVKLIKIDDTIRVALYATRIKGPLSDCSVRRGPAVFQGRDLTLPFDGDIPYPVPLPDWKKKKIRVRAPSKRKAQQSLDVPNKPAESKIQERSLPIIMLPESDNQKDAGA